MAVTTTPNIGLSKPTEVELGRNWAIGPDLTNSNNVIIEDKVDVNITTYAPIMICNTTNPNVGAGSIVGEYSEVQGFIFGNVIIRFLDPAVAPGTGTGAYGISLPTLVDNSFHALNTALTDTPGVGSCIGEGAFIDASAVATSGTFALDVARVAGVDYVRMVTETYAAKTARTFIPTLPFTIATNDKITLQFFYKKA